MKQDALVHGLKLFIEGVFEIPMEQMNGRNTSRSRSGLLVAPLITEFYKFKKNISEREEYVMFSNDINQKGFFINCYNNDI